MSRLREMTVDPLYPSPLRGVLFLQKLVHHLLLTKECRPLTGWPSTERKVFLDTLLPRETFAKAGRRRRIKTIKNTIMTTNEHAQHSQNLEARSTALTQVSPAVNLVAPTVSYSAGAQVLLLGPEHLLRLAIELFDNHSRLTCLVTEAIAGSARSIDGEGR